MRRILLTGATGFVGANLVRRLLRDGHILHLLVRHGYANWRIQDLLQSMQIHECVLHDAEAIHSILQRIRPEWVFHLATYGAYSWQTDLHKVIQTNVVGTTNLVQACLYSGVEAFVNSGSSSEYGFKTYSPSETEWLEPNSHYAVSKAYATQFCRYTAQNQKMRLHTLRLYSVYGPYEDPNRLIPALIRQGLAGCWPPLVNPDIARDYVYVDDAVEAYLLAITQTNQEIGAIYNVGTGIQITLKEVADVARQVLQIPVAPVWGTMPNRLWDTKVWVANNQVIQDKLGWRPKHTFEQGFNKTANWFRSNPDVLAFYQSYTDSNTINR